MKKNAFGFATIIEAYLDKFPFIGRYAEDFNIPSILPISLDLLDLFGYTRAWAEYWYKDLCLVVPEGRSIYILDKDGKELATAKPYHCTPKKTKWFGMVYDESLDIVESGETVYSVISGLPDIDRVGSVLVIEKERFNVKNNVAIYLIPGSVTMSVWLSQLGAMAKNEIERIISEVG